MKFLLTSLIALITIATHAQNTSELKTSLGGTARLGAVAFSINNKGYLGTGYLYDGTEHYFNDFWEYDPAADTWMQKADFAGAARHLAVGFSIGSKGYMGTGADFIFRKDFWEYDPVLNVWIQKADFEGTARGGAFGFSVGSKGYIGTGSDGSAFRKDFWEYDPLTDSWIQKSDFGGSARYAPTAFSMDGKGYAGTGLEGSTYKKDFWEYDPANDSWEKKTDFEGAARYGAVGFSIISGYIATGYGSEGYCKDIWEYDRLTDNWTQQIDFGGDARVNAVAFSITGKGYIGTGHSVATSENDLWDFTPEINLSSNPCVQPIFLYITDIGAASAIVHWTGSNGAFSYRIRKRIIGTSMWTYSSVAAPSTFKKITNILSNTFYEVQVQTYCNASKTDSSGYSTSVYFTSGCSLPVINVVSVSANPICKGNSAKLSIDGTLHDGTYWKWYSGSCGGIEAGSGASIMVSPDITTSFYVVGEGGCVITESCVPVTVTVNPPPKAKITPLGNLDICTSASVDLQAGFGSGFLYQWKNNGTNIAGATLQTYPATQEGEYKVKVTNSLGCTSTSKATIVFTSCKAGSSNVDDNVDEIQVYPNPVVLSTTIFFKLHQNANVLIALYDVTGTLQQTVLNNKVIAGAHSLLLRRNGLNGGIYFLKVVIDDKMMMRKVIIE